MSIIYEMVCDRDKRKNISDECVQLISNIHHSLGLKKTVILKTNNSKFIEGKSNIIIVNVDCSYHTYITGDPMVAMVGGGIEMTRSSILIRSTFKKISNKKDELINKINNIVKKCGFRVSDIKFNNLTWQIKIFLE